MGCPDLKQKNLLNISVLKDFLQSGDLVGSFVSGFYPLLLKKSHSTPS